MVSVWSRGGTFRRALVTGGIGFIGTNLAHRLLSDVNEVRLFDNLSDRLKTTSHLRRDRVIPFWQDVFLPDGEL
jgi:nucleoside-diphosphate-sugar epimerase